MFKGSPRRSPLTCSPSCRRCRWTSGSTLPRPTSGSPSCSSSWPGSAPTSGTTPTPATTRPRSSSTSSRSATRCGSPSAASCSRAATSPPSKKLGRETFYFVCIWWSVSPEAGPHNQQSKSGLHWWSTEAIFHWAAHKVVWWCDDQPFSWARPTFLSVTFYTERKPTIIMLLNTNPDIVVNQQQQQSSPHPGNLLPACQGHLHTDGGGHVVVLHPDHDLLLHRQPGRLPHRREDGVPHRVRRGPRQARPQQFNIEQNNITLLLHSMLLHFFYLHWIAYIQCLWKEKEYFCSGRCPLSHWPPGPGHSKSRHIFPCLEPCPAIAGILADLCINRSSKIFLLAFAEYIIRRVKWEDPSQ